LGVLCLALAVVAVGGFVLAGHPRTTDTPAQAATKQKPAIHPLTVTSTTPAAGATGVDTSATLTVTTSVPLGPSTPLPSLSPTVPGIWVVSAPEQMTFYANAPFSPGSHVTLTVPGGPDGLVGEQGQHLSQSVTDTFTVAPMSTLRVQELLAELGYLPLTFTPTSPQSPNQLADDQQGTFAWRWAPPATLGALWTQGSANSITNGAIMSFEDQHGLSTDGLAGPEVWSALLAATNAHAVTSQAYGYVLVNQTVPETATVYQNGAPVYSTPVNTGVPGATTVDGTFPVYVRYRVTTMTGTNPDGSHYSDPGIPWVSYFNGGDALHGFVRGGYGYPQSDGCVEMPPGNAAVVWPMTPIGTLVTVIGPPGH
jgi:peptidoglycan hydrolase-like protein with peptidoglycan-binding domain